MAAPGGEGVKPLAADGYRTQSEDTSREIEQMLIARWRAMTPEEKLAEIDDACLGGDDRRGRDGR